MAMSGTDWLCRAGVVKRGMVENGRVWRCRAGLAGWGKVSRSFDGPGWSRQGRFGEDLS